MNILCKTALGMGTAAILLTSTAPAYAAVHHDGGTASVLKASGEWNGWGRGGRHRHRDRVDGGDILAGIGILAGIAIIAGAASKSDRQDRSSQPQPNGYPDPSYDRDYRGEGYSSARGNDIGDAVQTCSAAAEQKTDAHVSEVRSANRDGNGWRVEGDLSNGDGFTCGVNNGRVDYIQLGNG